jgi:hypothetical protein
MAIIKRITITLTLLLIIAYNGYGKNETVQLVSLDGKLCKVKLVDKAYKSKLILESDGDSICLGSYIGDYKTEIWNDKFLYCEYGIRGGTGLSINRCVILCIYKNKLYITFSAISNYSSIFNKTFDHYADSMQLYDERNIYNISFIRKNISDLVIAVHDSNKSKYNPQSSYSKFDTVKLNYNERNKIFYNTYTKLGGEYIENFDNGYNKEDTVFLKYQSYPEVNLLQHKYYFINDYWCERENGNHLLVIGKCQ